MKMNIRSLAQKMLFLFFLVLTTNVVQAQTAAEAFKLIEQEKTTDAAKIADQLATTNTPEAQFLASEVYSQIGNTDKAQALNSKVAALSDVKNSYVLLAQGRAALQKGDVAVAKKTFDKLKSVAKKAKNPTLLALAGTSFLYGDKKDPKSAIAYLEQANLIKKSYDTYMALGDAYLEENDGGKAVTNYEYAADIDKANAYPHYKIGKVYTRAKNHQLILQSFDKALAIDPKFAPAYRAYGEYLYQINQFALAKAKYDKYLQLSDPTFTDKLYYINMNFLSKDYANTLKLISEINSSDQADSTKNYLNRLAAYSYYETGENAKAQEALETFMNKAGADKLIAMDYKYYGKILEKSGQKDKALSNYIKAFEKDSTETEILTNIADFYLEQSKYDDAIKYYNLKMSKKKNPDAQDYFDLGYAYYAIKDYKKADEYFAKVTEIKPTAASGHLWRAKTNKKNDPDGTNGAAKPYYEKFVEIAGSDLEKYSKDLADAYLYLAIYYAQQQDIANAKNYVAKTLQADPANKKAIEMQKGLGM